MGDNKFLSRLVLVVFRTSDCSDLLRGELASQVGYLEDSIGVKLILGFGCPFEIFDSVVVFCAVDVIHFLLCERIGYEDFCNESMNAIGFMNLTHSLPPLVYSSMYCVKRASPKSS